jgi:outer membrane protein assembly factor BamB
MMRLFVIAVALLAVGACSKDKEINPPAELVEISPTLKVERAWTAGVGDGGEELRLGLSLAVRGKRVYGAGRGGDVAAFELATGKQLWRTRTKAPLAAGTGASEDTIAVGTSDGQVIALNASDGAIRWRVPVAGEVLSAPAVAARAIVVRTVDGKLHGLASSDGHELWLFEQQVPRLTLRGTSRPTIVGDVVICGFDNGKVAAVNLSDGSLAWEATVAPPHGRTELERLVDIDSAIQAVGDDVYVVGFQGRVAMLALDNGQVWWSREASSYRGLAVDDDAVYFSNATGEVVALRRRTGAELWRQNTLLHRGLSAPAAGNNTVAVADFEGYVHFLDKASGAVVARMPSGGTRVSNPPVVAADLLVVINDGGRISAFRIPPSAAKAPSEAPAPNTTTPETAKPETSKPETAPPQTASPETAPPEASEPTPPPQ